MDKYSVLFYETRKQTIEVKAESEQEAIEKIKAWQKKGSLRSGELCGMDFDVINVEPLKTEKLQRFEIFGEEALFTELPLLNVYWLGGTEGLYRYDLRHGDDDSYPQVLENSVFVNRFGTVFTTKPLLKEGETRRLISDDDWGFLSDLDDCTPEQFIEEMRLKEKSQQGKSYEILQLNRASSVYAFCNYDFLQHRGVSLDSTRYDSVYRGTMEEGMNLESIFAKFNIDRPEDFKGHSLSVSDVVVLRDCESQTAYFVDSFGFKELPEFFDVPLQDKKEPDKNAVETPKRTPPHKERT